MLKKLEKILFYLLIFCLPLQVRHIFYSWGDFNEWKSVYLYLTDFFILGLVIFWVVGIIINKRINFERGWIELALAIFLAISGLSLVVTTNLKLGIYSYLKLLEFSAFFLYIKNNFYNLGSSKDRRSRDDQISSTLVGFWLVFIASAFFQGLVAILQFFKQGSLGLNFLTESPIGSDIAGVAKIVVGGQKIIRAYGLMPHPNILAAFLMIAIFGLVFLFIKRYKQSEIYEKIIYGIVFGVVFLALFFTFSRSITLIGSVLLVVWLIIAAVKNKNYREPIKAIFLLLAIGFLLVAAFYWPYFSSRFNASDILSGQALGLRISYSQITFEFIKKNPIWGIGQGNFVSYFSQIYNLFQNWIWQPVHNIYLLIAAEIGVLGLLAFLWLIFEVGRRALKVLKNKIFTPESYLIFIFCFVLLIGFLDHFWWDLQQGQIMFWLFLGALASLRLRS